MIAKPIHNKTKINESDPVIALARELLEVAGVDTIWVCPGAPAGTFNELELLAPTEELTGGGAAVVVGTGTAHMMLVPVATQLRVDSQQ
jgi:hypothetical protein